MGKKSVKNTTPTINDHEEMFLAKIAGENIEMPEVTNHKEIWLKRIAENSGGSDVIINPTLAGTEANATGIEVDGTKYRISKVKANPTLAGTEANLTGVEVDGTKYKVPEAKKLYYHNIVIETQPSPTSTTRNYIYLSLISSTSTQFASILDIATALSFNTSKKYACNATGSFWDANDYGTIHGGFFEYVDGAWRLSCPRGMDYQHITGYDRFTFITSDTVTEI